MGSSKTAPRSKARQVLDIIDRMRRHELDELGRAIVEHDIHDARKLMESMQGAIDELRWTDAKVNRAVGAQE